MEQEQQTPNKKFLTIGTFINDDDKVQGFWRATEMSHMEKGVLVLELEGILKKIKDEWLDSDYIEQTEED